MRDEYRRNSMTIPMDEATKNVIVEAAEKNRMCAATWARMILIREAEKENKKCTVKK